MFDKSNNHYSWKKVTTTIHNIIVGKLWIDQVNVRSEVVCLMSHDQSASRISDVGFFIFG